MTGTGHGRRELGFERIVFFSDAVFAIAITLLALEIRVPDLESPAAALPQALLGLAPATAAYVLSFLVIGLFWVGHHRLFSFVVDYDYRLAWQNLFFLLGIAFVPVPTQVISKYGNLPLATMFYAGSVAVVALLEFFVWRAAAARQTQLLRPGTTPRQVSYFGLRILAIAVVFVLSMPLALLSPLAAQLSWGLVFLVQAGLRSRYPEVH
jgi:uncharacterized membrane protein